MRSCLSISDNAAGEEDAEPKSTHGKHPRENLEAKAFRIGASIPDTNSKKTADLGRIRVQDPRAFRARNHGFRCSPHRSLQNEGLIYIFIRENESATHFAHEVKEQVKDISTSYVRWVL